MKVYLFPYGIGTIVDAPTSKEWVVLFQDGTFRHVFRAECILWQQ